MKVPPQRSPKHQGNLTGGRDSWLKIAAAGIRDGRDEQGVVMQRWFSVSVYMTQAWPVCLQHGVFVRGWRLVCIGVVLTVQHDGPAWWHLRVLVDIEVTELEVQSSIDR